ncbi:MAG: CPCC family cysteine-rich protein [Solirubrobacteraceae bacterium]
MAAKYPCPCCGHVIFLEPPGSYDICEICFWEDDIVMLRWPTNGGGANHASLVEAQHNYAEFGAGERAHLVHVRPATDAEPVEDGWRPIDLERDSFEPPGVQEAPWPEDPTVLYWWRPTFWRRDRAPGQPE